MMHVKILTNLFSCLWDILRIIFSNIPAETKNLHLKELAHYLKIFQENNMHWNSEIAVTQPFSKILSELKLFLLILLSLSHLQ